MQAPFPSLDLHVLSVPPAFILSQDQTLNLIRSLLLGFELTGIFLPFPLSCFHSIKFFLLRCYTVRFSKFLHISLFAKCFAILSHRIQFVKQFFQLFSNFFDVVRLARTDDILSYSLPFVNTFLKLFSSFFRCRRTEKEGFEPSRQFPDLRP